MLAATLLGALGVITFLQAKAHHRTARWHGVFALRRGTHLVDGGGTRLCAQASALLSPKIIVILTLWLAFVSAAAFSLWNHLSTLHPVNLLASYRFLIPVAGIVESLLFHPR